jgi:hypothetical protein
MLMTGSDTARDQLLIALAIDQTDVGTIANRNIAVAALQSGACDDAVCARTTAVVDPSGDCVQPGPTILIGKGHAGLSNTITLETKALTSRMCVRPQAAASVPKSSLV